MKHSKKIIIRSRVFALDDLKRIGEVFEKQRKLADRSDHRAHSQFEIQFSDNTSVESHSTEILNDDVLNAPGRPVEIRFVFRNYSLDRHLSFSISHGESTYGNVATISASETTWLNDNFAALNKAIDTAKPQTFWFRKHPTLLLHLIAFGLGALIHLVIAAILWGIIYASGTQNLKIDVADDWNAFLSALAPLWFTLLWLSRWFTGVIWAFPVRGWLLRLWPNIELDVGVEHMKIEKQQRQRLGIVLSLIVVPIATSAVYDAIIFAF